jgi:hypothetical protein
MGRVRVETGASIEGEVGALPLKHAAEVLVLVEILVPWDKNRKSDFRTRPAFDPGDLRILERFSHELHTGQRNYFPSLTPGR